MLNAQLRNNWRFLYVALVVNIVECEKRETFRQNMLQSLPDRMKRRKTFLCAVDGWRWKIFSEHLCCRMESFVIQ